MKTTKNKISIYLARVIPVPLIVFRVVCPAETGAQAKVCQFYVSISIDQNIVWFNVAVNETHFMNTLHCAHQLRNIESMDEKTHYNSRFNSKRIILLCQDVFTWLTVPQKFPV